jgi:uncharacterized membrane protein
MEVLVIGIVGVVLLGPIVALALALTARRQLRRLRVELASDVEDVRRRLGILSRRVRALEPPEAQAPAGPAPPQPAVAAPTPTPCAGEDASAERPPGPPEPGPVVPEASEEPATAWPPAVPVELPRPAETPARSFEELLGGSLLVWIGGVALALAGAFLVKYSFDQGWIGPPVRVALGLAFGLALIGVGEGLRRRSARVAQAASAAGVATLFAALLAGTNLYLVIPPLVGFAGMAATTAVAVFLSQRHGPFVAGLGLLGGFLTPALIREGEPRPALLVTYLLVLQLGLLVITRRRGWWPLAIATVVGVNCWIGYWLTELPPAAHDP